VKVDVSLLPVSSQHQIRMLFIVSDTGIGIGDDLLSGIFQPFIQAEGSFVRRFQGAGLGLSIVRRLVRLMGGSLAVDNAECGTTFYVSLTFYVPQPEARDIAPLAPCSAPHGRGALNILVAEDDEVSRDVIVRMLKKCGHAAVAVSNGQEALERLKEKTFDVVLLDVRLPGLTGQATLERLHAAGIEAKVIAVTGHASADDALELLRLGAFDYILKPCKTEKILELIDKAHKQLTKERAGA